MRFEVPTARIDANDDDKVGHSKGERNRFERHVRLQTDLQKADCPGWATSV
jgi:hypothetical protein